MTCNFSINHVCPIVNEIFIPTACKRRIDTLNEDFSIRLFNEYNNMYGKKYDAGLIIFFLTIIFTYKNYLNELFYQGQLLAKVMFFLIQNKCRNADNNICICINFYERSINIETIT